MPDRDAERSKRTILQAAEDLFARDGFERTSLQQIAEAAGFGRSTPAYFFSTKQQLYDTVLRQVLERGRAAVRPAFEAALTSPSPEQALDTIVGDLLHFLARDQNYVLIMQREALAARPSLAALLAEESLAEARIEIARALGQEDSDHFFLELFALAWFPFAHDSTLVAALGFDARDAAFLRRHRERIVRLFTPAELAVSSVRTR
jgi:AcrR family transcriptional regulator